MLKYILKRLFISIFILFGVSVIIYTMVRLMPNDYVDTKYAAQLQSGTIKQSDIDNFKKLYGLELPEAYLKVELPGGVHPGTYSRSVKIADYEDTVSGLKTPEEWLCGGYENGKYKLELLSDGSATLSTVTYVERTENRIATDDAGNVKRDENGEIVYEDITVTAEQTDLLMKGSYTVLQDSDGTISITLSLSEVTVDGYGKVVSGAEPVLSETLSVQYRVANFFDKFGSILSGYFNWIGNLCRGDLGVSFKYGKPVAQCIGENMWISFAIALVATILQFLIAIPLGISSATHQYSARDYTVTVFTMIGLSLPTYFFAAIAIKIFAVDLGWLPSNGLIYATATYTQDFAGMLAKFGDMVQHLILPIFVTVILSLGGLMRYTRTNMLEVLGADYIRTARAKGLSEKSVIYKHAFRNTLIPLATLLAGILPSLFGGMMITEQVFGIPGIGQMAYQALRNGDIPFVMGYNMFLAILTIIGTLLSDIMYSVVDPRVKLGK